MSLSMRADAPYPPGYAERRPIACPVTGIASCLGSRRARDEAATRHEQFRSALSAHIDDATGLDGELGGWSAKGRQILPPLAFAFISL